MRAGRLLPHVLPGHALWSLAYGVASFMLTVDAAGWKLLSRQGLRNCAVCHSALQACAAAPRGASASLSCRVPPSARCVTM